MYSVNRIKILHKNKKNWGFPILRTETQKFFSHQTHTCGVSRVGGVSSNMILRFLISFFSKLNSLRERHFQTFWRFQWRFFKRQLYTVIHAERRIQDVITTLSDYARRHTKWYFFGNISCQTGIYISLFSYHKPIWARI